jgi:hypothetical protein
VEQHFEFYVIDDVVEKPVQDLLEDTLLGADTNWVFNRHRAYANHNEVTRETKNSLMTFSHLIQSGDVTHTDKINLYLSVVKNSMQKIGIKSAECFNAVSHIQLPKSMSSLYGVPHVDSHTPNQSYLICIYYVTDSDGDTLVFKQNTSNTTQEQVKSGIINIETDVVQRITPKKGRAVVFDGSQYHCAGRPHKDSIRCVLNFNIRNIIR